MQPGQEAAPLRLPFHPIEFTANCPEAGGQRAALDPQDNSI